VANPTSSSAASRRAITPPGQVENGAIAASSLRMSSSSSGARRFGGVARSRRIPDSARRTTSERPGAARPAAVWNWLIEEVHRVSVAGLYRHCPTPVWSAAAAVRYAATTIGSAGNTGCPAPLAHPWNRAQSDRYAAFVFTDVDAWTAAHTRSSASTGKSRASTGTPWPAPVPLSGAGSAVRSAAEETSRSVSAATGDSPTRPPPRACRPGRCSSAPCIDGATIPLKDLERKSVGAPSQLHTTEDRSR